jgi:hypothetical protein
MRLPDLSRQRALTSTNEAEEEASWTWMPIVDCTIVVVGVAALLTFLTTPEHSARRRVRR